MKYHPVDTNIKGVRKKVCLKHGIWLDKKYVNITHKEIRGQQLFRHYGVYF